MPSKYCQKYLNNLFVGHRPFARAHFAVLVQRAESTLGTCRPTGYAEAAYRDRSRVLCLPRRIAHVSLLLQEPPARPPFVLAKG